MTQRVLCISVHPDDETLGCGGTLLKEGQEGSEIFWLIVTQAREPQWSKEIIRSKEREILKVAEAYKVKRFFQLDFPAAKLDTIPQSHLIQRIRDLISEVRPELIYSVHGGDVHSDHRVVFSAMLSAVKPFYMNQLAVRRIVCYETLSSTEAAAPFIGRSFVPNVFSDIAPYIERKIEIMKLYQTESQLDPLPRGPSAIRALARYRGTTVGVEYAEAFMLIRELA